MCIPCVGQQGQWNRVGVSLTPTNKYTLIEQSSILIFVYTHNLEFNAAMHEALFVPQLPIKQLQGHMG